MHTGIGVGASQLREADSDACGYQSEQDDAVHDEHRSARVDASDQGGRDTPPGVGQGEADAENREDGIVALEVLLVAHLCQLHGIGVERASVKLVNTSHGVALRHALSVHGCGAWL